MANKKHPETKTPSGGKERRYKKPTLTKHGPLSTEAAAFSLLY